MFTKKNNTQGQDNRRLHAKKPTNNEGTAAWQNSESKDKTDKVNHPSYDSVNNAKDWVDNGSQL